MSVVIMKRSVIFCGERIPRAKIRVLLDFEKYAPGTKTRGGFSNIFWKTGNWGAYLDYWYAHAHWLREHGFIDFDEDKKEWYVTEKGKKLLEELRKVGYIE